MAKLASWGKSKVAAGPVNGHRSSVFDSLIFRAPFVLCTLVLVTGCKHEFGRQSAAPVTTQLALDRYNYVIGTQTIGASYQFTPAPRLVETASRIRELGAHVIKFSITPSGSPNNQSLAEVAEKDAVVRQVLDMPFSQVILWALPQATRNSLFENRTLPIEYQQIYDLTIFLRTTYKGSRREFYLGNWEGDWELTHVGTHEPNANDVEAMIEWARTRQRAVDDAKRSTPDSDVGVFYYIEVNRVHDAQVGKTRVSNAVLPMANPDFVSYSSYDALDDQSMQQLRSSLDYLQSKLSAKAGLPERRVFIGEFGFPASHYTPEQQDELSKQVMLAGLAWGCRFVLYWEFYNNEVEKGIQKGFWMVDDKGIKQPIYFSLENYYRSANAFVRDFGETHHRLPLEREFDNAAKTWLR